MSLYVNMLELRDICPNNYIFSCILKACCNMDSLFYGMTIHYQSTFHNMESDVIIGSTLIDLYMKFGLLMEARIVFDGLPHRNVVSYGAIIVGYAQNNHGHAALQLFEHMLYIGIQPNRVIFLGVLAACGSETALRESWFVHDLIVRNGLNSDLAVANTIIDMYSKCGSIEEACKVFRRLVNPNIVSWGAIISGYVQHGHYEAVFQYFQEMENRSVQPNRVIFLSLLQACKNTGSMKQAEYVHDQIKSEDLESDSVIRSALIDMWVTLGEFQTACKLFDDTIDRNVVTWSVMLSGYVHHEQGASALELFERMQQSVSCLDKFVYTCVLKACGLEQTFMEIMLLHHQIIDDGLEKDVSIGSSLIDSYAKCGVVEEARRVFDNLLNKNEVSWGAMLAGYNQHNKELSALELFQKMLQDGAEPDKVRLLCVLKACGSIGTLWQGKLVHNLIRIHKLHMDVVLGNALIDMYAKCGELEEAFTVFSTLQDRDIVSWGALISGCAQHGLFKIVILLLKAMQCEGMRPNDKIFSSVLSTCSHAGLAEEGYQQFKSMMLDHSILPSTEHINCVVDLFSRVGCLKEAEQLLENISLSPDSLAWTSLLTACRTYGNLKFGKHCYEHVIQLNPSVSSGYVTMSHILADAYLGGT
ncbi:hypothetical protein KP509_04G109500 [Ceratopteris richardii]|nr:hypothetical protein KP509_04G109500 [Ceratopteris richardii]